MLGSKVCLLLSCMLVWVCSACSTPPRAEVADWDDVAEQFVRRYEVVTTAAALAELNGPQPSGATWFNLCWHKDCGADAVRYTQRFREAAILSSVIRQLDRLSARVHGPAPTPALVALMRRGDEWLLRIDERIASLEAELAVMSPARDFHGRRRRLAENGLALAREQVAFALTRAPDVQARVAGWVRVPEEPNALPSPSDGAVWPAIEETAAVAAECPG